MIVGNIDNDVLFGKDGELYLASGGHHVLEYALARRPVDPAVVDIFRTNIKERALFLQGRDIPYLHVIIPDKQSVQVERFVSSDPVRLGPIYLNALCDENVRTLYPIDELRDQTSNTFLKTDTHLSDFGSILVGCRVAEELFGHPLEAAKAHLLSTLVIARSHTGDLGKKLTPPQEAMETFSSSVWKRKTFHNDIPGGNNGGVELAFAPTAEFSKRVLWFGDSFGRELVRFLSYFFQEILFLRTPFFHPEFVDQYRPDLVVSQNIERYLASCTPDEQRPLFHMFPALSGRATNSNPAFAEAFSAAMSFPRSPYVKFMTKLKDTLSRPAASTGASMTPQTNQAASVANTTLSHSIYIPPGNLSRAAELGIIPNIHPHDFIYKFVAKKWGADTNSAVNNYYDLGVYSSKLTLELIQEVSRVKKSLSQSWQPRRILDFASGYGGTSRHLHRVFPDSLISTCDIHPEAVSFNSEVLGLQSHQSAAEPEDVVLPENDLIVAMSFFSHMPASTYGRWLQTLASRLSPGGVLIFTANGHVTESRATTRVSASQDGFGFAPRSEQSDLDGAQYGITISHPRWVMRTLEAIPGIRLARFQEGLWWAIQDTYVCVRDLE